LLLKPLLKGLEHGCHKSHLLVAPKFLVGLLCVGGLTCGCTKGLAILVVLATVVGIARLMRAAVSLATLAKPSLRTFFGTRSDEPPDERFLGLG